MKSVVVAGLFRISELGRLGPHKVGETQQGQEFMVTSSIILRDVPSCS